jgi:hypothetical protein
MQQIPLKKHCFGRFEVVTTKAYNVSTYHNDVLDESIASIIRMEATFPTETAKVKHKTKQCHMLAELQNILCLLIWNSTRREFKSFLRNGFTTS